MNFVYKTVAVAATVLAATSCIQDEALNTECDILTCSLPAEVVMSDPKITNDPTKKYSIFNEIDNNGNFLMAWASGNPGFVMCGEADKAAKAKYGKTQYKDHIWEFFPTTAVYKEGTTLSVDGENVANFMLGDKYAQPEFIRLVTRSAGGFGSMVGMPIAAGNIFQGEFDLGNAISAPREATKFGEPYHYKPLTLSGEYRYVAGETFTDEKGKPVVGRTDIFSIYAIYFLTDDKVTYIDSNVHYNDFMHPNMVALANLTDARVTGLGDNDWVKFEITFDYSAYNKVVDKALLAKGRYKLGIVIASSAEGDYFRGSVGSTLDVRNLKVTHE